MLKSIRVINRESRPPIYNPLVDFNIKVTLIHRYRDTPPLLHILSPIAYVIELRD